MNTDTYLTKFDSKFTSVPMIYPLVYAVLKISFTYNLSDTPCFLALLLILSQRSLRIYLSL